MKFLATFFLSVLFVLPVWGQSNPPLRVREVDGTPTKSGINTLVVSNGSLSINGTTATVTTGVSGLSDVSGTLVSSSNFRVPATGGTASAPNLQFGTGQIGFFTTGIYLAVSSSGATSMGWNGENGNTHIFQGYSVMFGSSGLTAPDVGLTRPSAGAIRVTNASTGYGQLQAGGMVLNATAFASLGTPSDGTFLYCSDCTIANPCAGSGTGAFAKRLNGAWVCN